MSAARTVSPKNCAMTVETKLITDRRRVHYESFGEFLADAECQAARDVRTSGNWTLAQIFDHLSVMGRAEPASEGRVRTGH